MTWYSHKFGTTILIIRKDGTIYDLGKMGYRVKSFDPPLPQYQHTFQQYGTYGSTLLDTKVGQMTIPLVLNIVAYDTTDFELQRMRLRRIFRSDEEFYVMTTRMPALRWKVVADPITANQLNSFWGAKDVSINLQCADGYAETSATTTTPFTYSNYKYGAYELSPLNGYKMRYEWQTPDIKFYNPGTIPLLAEERPVKIIFNGKVDKSLSIKNKTTEQEIRLDKSLGKKDELIWQGLVPIVNNKQEYSHTNHGYLDFVTGWNELYLTGASNFKITFDTRFYY